MTTHISDELPRLLTGDATRDVVMHAAAHLRTCVDCQQELVSAVVAHASLMSAHRFAPEIVSSTHDLDGVELDDDGELPPVSTLPDLSGVFAEAHADAVVTPIRRMRTRRALVGFAAAAAVVVGGGATYAVVHDTGTSSGPAQRTVALVGVTRAKAVLVGNDQMRIDATSLPVLDRNHQYEVWLTDDDGAQKQSIGFIGNSRVVDLSVPSRVMSQYNNIAVSVQQLHQTEYSGNTVLHGTYG